MCPLPILAPGSSEFGDEWSLWQDSPSEGWGRTEMGAVPRALLLWVDPSFPSPPLWFEKSGRQDENTDLGRKH